MIINLDKAQEIKSEFDKYKSDALSLYKHCQSSNMSVSDYLEKLDPSERNEEGNVTGIDAFTRHMMVMDLQVAGNNALTLEKLGAQAEYLMPELILRTVKKGMEVAAQFSYLDCLAAVVPVKGIHYHPLYIPDLDRDSVRNRREKSAGARANSGKGGEFPVLSISAREKDIVAEDIGRVIEAEYAVIKDYPFQEFAVLLMLIGAQLAADKLQNLYDLGITGDGTVGAATNTFSGAAGTLAYSDLVDNTVSFNSPFVMNCMLAPQQSVENILTMAQFQDPLAGWEFQRTGKFVTPMGASLKQVGATPGSVPTGTVMVTLDKRYAAKEIVSQPLGVEADKIIERKFEQAVVSEKSRMCVIADGAVKRIVWT